MVEVPSKLKISKEEYLENFKTDILTVSGGRLFDFSPSSVLSILGETQSLSITRLIELQLEILPYVSANVIEQLGFVRSRGSYAVATVRFQLSGVFDREYVILRGTRFALLGNVVFQTQGDLIIPANIDTTDPLNYQYCRVDAIAIEIGIAGNQPAQQASILQIYPELDAIWLDENSAGGNDEELPEQFFDRVSLIIAKFLETQFSLVQTSEFELTVEGILGTNSVAVAVPDISENGNTVSIASMNIFAINPDGTPLNSAQIRDLSSKISERAPLVSGRLYFSPLIIPLVNVDISIKINQSDNSNTISDTINNEIRRVFSIKNTVSMNSLELYEAVYQVKLNGGLTPIIKWGYLGDVLQARDLPLPKIVLASAKTSPVKINIINVIIEPSGFTRTYTQ